MLEMLQPLSWLVLRQKLRFLLCPIYACEIMFIVHLVVSSSYKKVFSFEVLYICQYLYYFHYFQVLRDGKWIEEEASVLVPGDIISVKLGDIIPADARLLEGDPLKIDQVML